MTWLGAWLLFASGFAAGIAVTITFIVVVYVPRRRRKHIVMTRAALRTGPRGTLVQVLEGPGRSRWPWGRA